MAYYEDMNEESLTPSRKNSQRKKEKSLMKSQERRKNAKSEMACCGKGDKCVIF